MTNLEKFIQIMNTTFDAGFTPENMELGCSPCGVLKKYEYACQDYECEKCKEWWHKEYSDMTKEFWGYDGGSGDGGSCPICGHERDVAGSVCPVCLRSWG